MSKSKRRKRRNQLNTSDEDYVLSEDSEHSSANETDTSSATSKKRSLLRRKQSEDAELVRDTPPKTTPSKTPIFSKGSVSSKFHSKRRASVELTPPTLLEDPLVKSLGPLMTPPPLQCSAITVTPISLISTPLSGLIQTQSHTISGIELLPSGSESSGTHVATVEGVSLLDQTPPITPGTEIHATLAFVHVHVTCYCMSLLVTLLCLYRSMERTWGYSNATGT